MFHNTPFLPYFHWKSVYCDCAWYDEYLGSIYQKWKILTLVYVFAHKSKSILPQSASFSQAGTHICRYCVFTLWGSIILEVIKEWVICGYFQRQYYAWKCIPSQFNSSVFWFLWNHLFCSQCTHWRLFHLSIVIIGYNAFWLQPNVNNKT